MKSETIAAGEREAEAEVNAAFAMWILVLRSLRRSRKRIEVAKYSSIEELIRLDGGRKK